MKKFNTSKKESISLKASLIETGKILPQSVVLEDAVLGTIMSYNNISAVNHFLTSEAFYKEENKYVYEACQACYNDGLNVDMLNVHQKLLEINKLEDVGGAYYLSALCSKATSDIEYKSRIILQNYIKRKMIEKLHELSIHAFDDSYDVFDLLDEYNMYAVELQDLIDKPNFKAESIADQFIKNLETENPKSGSIFINRKTGFPSFDKYINWSPNKLMLMAGEGKDGKTKLVSMLAFQLLKNDKNTSIFWVTLEDTSMDIFATYMADKVFMKPKDIIMKKGFNEKKKAKAKKYSEIWKKYDIVFHDDSIDIKSVHNKFKSFCEKRPDRFNMLIVDNLLSLDDRNKYTFNPNGLYDHVLGVCADIRRDTKGFIILVHHFNSAASDKDNVKHGFRPNVTSIKGSEASRRVPNYIFLINNLSKKKQLLNEYRGKKNEILQNLMIVDPVMLRDENNTTDDSLIRLYANLDYNIFFELNKL